MKLEPNPLIRIGLMRAFHISSLVISRPPVVGLARSPAAAGLLRASDSTGRVSLFAREVGFATPLFATSDV